MIDVYATEGTFADKHTLAQNLARAVMRWEQVPEIPLFSDNTAAFIHDLPAEAIANADGASSYVRVQILTPVGVLDRDKQLGVVKELTEIVAAAAGDPSYTERTWVLITESPEGGWGIAGHANTDNGSSFDAVLYGENRIMAGQPRAEGRRPRPRLRPLAFRLVSVGRGVRGDRAVRRLRVRTGRGGASRSRG